MRSWSILFRAAGKEARAAKIDPLIHWLDEVQFYSLGGEI
jgi:hypothetical protein